MTDTETLSKQESKRVPLHAMPGANLIRVQVTTQQLVAALGFPVGAKIWGARLVIGPADRVELAVAHPDLAHVDHGKPIPEVDLKQFAQPEADADPVSAILAIMKRDGIDAHEQDAAVALEFARRRVRMERMNEKLQLPFGRLAR